MRKGSSQPILVKVGDVLTDVKVQSMLGWGAFIDVGNGHRGLLHVDEMKWPEGAMAPSAYDCVKEEQSVEVPPTSDLACAAWLDEVWLFHRLIRLSLHAISDVYLLSSPPLYPIPE